MDPTAPKDKWNIISMTLIFHGVGTLIAWDMFITAKDYFVKYKLVDTVYAHNFLAYVGWASQIPNLLFNWFNVFADFGGRLTKRIIGSIIIMLGIFLVTEVLVMIDTSETPGMFFWITMICIFILNASNAVYQNSIFGVVARLPPRYMAAYVLGNNLCGIIVVGMAWVCGFCNDYRTSAIYYFFCGMFVLVVCLDSYVGLPINKFYRYCRTHVKHDPPTPGTKRSVPYKLIFRQTKMQLYNVYITFVVALSVYPAVISDVMPVKEGFLGDNFMLITCFLTFNVTAMIGNITAGVWRFPNKNLLFLLTTARLALFPMILLCNYQVPGRTLPIVFTNDWVFWFIVSVQGWSAGHASTLALIYVGGEVAPENTTKAGMIGAAMFMSGVMSGVLVTHLAPTIVTLSVWK